MSETGAYEPPDGPLCLSGPVTMPAQGTLPLRGDLAHVTLADRYLVPHYVVPALRHVTEDGTQLKLAPGPDSETLAELGAGSTFELLDCAGDWGWGCLGPQGPTGYVPLASLGK